MATFYNKATLSYNNISTDSNIVTGELVEVLSVTKTALENSYRSDGTVTYLVNIVNSGAVPYTGLTVSDDLGAYAFNTATLVPLNYVDGSLRYYSNGVLQPTPAVTADPRLEISGVTVPANGNVLLIYKTNVNRFAPLGTADGITNTAAVSGAALPNDIEASETVNQENAADLSISKTVSPETVAANGEITYTFVIQNRGSLAAAASDNVTVTDTFDPALKNISVTLDSAALAQPADYTYDETTGLFRTTAGRITVPAATYTVDPTTGERSVVPGVTVLKVTGTL